MGEFSTLHDDQSCLLRGSGASAVCEALTRGLLAFGGFSALLAKPQHVSSVWDPGAHVGSQRRSDQRNAAHTLHLHV